MKKRSKVTYNITRGVIYENFRRSKRLLSKDKKLDRY